MQGGRAWGPFLRSPAEAWRDLVPSHLIERGRHSVPCASGLACPCRGHRVLTKCAGCSVAEPIPLPESPFALGARIRLFKKTFIKKCG